MKLRKISARYIFTSEKEILENGIIVTNEEGVIFDIVNKNDQIKEEEGLEYYSGIICPGFIYSFNSLKFVNSLEARQNDLFLFNSGIVAVGDYSYQDNINYYKQGTKILYQDITSGFNFFHHPGKCILTHEHDGEIISCIAAGINSDKKYLSPKTIIIDLLESGTTDNFNNIVEMFCVNGAKFLGIDDSYGSFKKGKKPGINLITGLNIYNLKDTINIKVKKLL